MDKFVLPVFNFKKLSFLLLLFLLISCENHRFDSDMRQIEAKNLIMHELHRPKSFDVTGFSQDTIPVEGNENFKKEIRYLLDIEYLDSNNVFQKKQAIVLFTPDGRSVISSNISGR